MHLRHMVIVGGCPDALGEATVLVFEQAWIGHEDIDDAEWHDMAAPAELIVDRPEPINAIDHELREEFSQLFTDVEIDDVASVVNLTEGAILLCRW